MLARLLAGRLCHDLMSPASGIVSGLDFLDDPGGEEMRAEAMGLIASSARKLMDLLVFYRVAVGGYAEGEAFDTAQLRTLTEGIFAHVRPSLDWAVDASALSGEAARALLNLAQIAAGALALGGVARISVRRENGRLTIVAEADGPRQATLIATGSEVAIAQDARGLLAADGIGAVYVVTHAWHMRRALIAFRHFGLAATPAPTELDAPPRFTLAAFIPSLAGWRMSYYGLHEWIGCAYYAWR